MAQKNPKNCIVRWFNKSDNGYKDHISIGDWALGKYKGEIDDDAYIAGIASYNGSNKISAILECKLK